MPCIHHWHQRLAGDVQCRTGVLTRVSSSFLRFEEHGLGSNREEMWKERLLALRFERGLGSSWEETSKERLSAIVTSWQRYTRVNRWLYQLRRYSSRWQACRPSCSSHALAGLAPCKETWVWLLHLKRFCLYWWLTRT